MKKQKYDKLEISIITKRANQNRKDTQNTYYTHNNRINK